MNQNIILDNLIKQIYQIKIEKIKNKSNDKITKINMNGIKEMILDTINYNTQKNTFYSKNKNSALKQLRNILPHGDIGRIINSFIFLLHPDTIQWRKNNHKLKNNEYPKELVLIKIGFCKICKTKSKICYQEPLFKCYNEDGIRIHSQNKLGWFTCKNCIPYVKNVLIPKTCELYSILPSKCYNVYSGKKKIIKWGAHQEGKKLNTNNFKTTQNIPSLKFMRISKFNPERNGITNCFISLDDDYFNIKEDSIVITIIWLDLDFLIKKKYIPLANLIKHNSFLWKNSQEFIKDFGINKNNLTDYAMQIWTGLINKAFNESIYFSGNSKSL